MRQCFCGDEGKCFFGAPFDALRFFGFVVCAAVAGKHDVFFGVHVHGAELAGADAPAAAVAGVFVDADDAAARFLC